MIHPPWIRDTFVTAGSYILSMKTMGIVAAALLSSDPLELSNVPEVTDVKTMLNLI